jgi:putative transposase
MTETTTQGLQPQDLAGAELDGVDEQLAARLVAQARSQGISLVGPDGLLQQLTKLVLGSALEGELTDHLGYPRGDPAGRNGANSRNGTRPKRRCCIEPECAGEAQQSGGSPSWKGARRGRTTRPRR